MKTVLLVVALSLFTFTAHARPRAVPPVPKPAAPQPTVFTEEMTWEEVRDALKAGKTTVIIATGGVEQNGPYLVTGKHNYIVRAAAEAVARKLGNALVAPVVPFVPEGDIAPPTGHMKYPGTISVRESTFEALLTDICASYRAHGFREIILIGDSGGNQAGMKAVVKRMSAERAAGNTRVHYIPEYYDPPGFDDWLAKQGIRETDEGIHDSYSVSASLAAVHPTLIRAERRIAAGTFSINGVPLAPLEKTRAMGRKILDWYADVTAKAIQKAIAGKK